MKQLLIAIMLTAVLAVVSVSCSKDKAYCYACSAISGSTTYYRNVCTEGDPTANLPTQDANGRYRWSCTKR